MNATHYASMNKSRAAALLLAFAVAWLLAPSGVTGAKAAPTSSSIHNVLGDDGQDRSDLDPITRGELAKKVSNAAHFHDDPGPQVFQDIAPANPYYSYVNRLANRGIISGYTCGTVIKEPCVAPDNLPYFRPDADAMRGQGAKMISNAAGF